MKSVICVPIAFLFACAPKTADLPHARQAIAADSLLAHIKILSSDEFEGRAPATKGEELTVSYLTGQFKKLGLQPGNPDGSYAQGVPLVGISSDVTGSIRAAGKSVTLTPVKDFAGVSRPQVETNEVKDSGIVFVGYGIVAPEYQWDDYKGLDVKGKTILMLVNDPPTADGKLFKGKAMTYYGRWTYKYEIASEKGAAAAIIIHETGPAGYPFEVVSGSGSHENFDIATPDKNMKRVPVEAWISTDKAKELLKASGQDFDQLKAAAAKADFKPVALNAKADFKVKNTIRQVVSQNVVAKLPGAESKDEYIIYTAHWDHLGRDTRLQGDQIFNGALDNASGTAALLELAKAFSTLDPKPKRSILFLAVTAEEKGLLGTRYYARNPLYPLAKTLANINMDGVNQWGRTKDLSVVGIGQSTLEDDVSAVLKSQDRVMIPETEPQKGYYYRSDHFEFAKEGVPALYLGGDADQFIGKPTGYGKQKREEYIEKDYHKVSDEAKPDWDLSGAVENLQLLFEVGYRVTQDDKWPEWKSGSEFKARRDRMMGK
jgi:Zn-dependent M28 family amino/carboxypeptidase